MTAHTWPSYPETFALAATCVSTGPKVVAPNVLLQLLENLNCWHWKRKKSGVCSGAASERNLPTWREATQSAQFAARDGGISKQPFDLTLSVFQEFAVGDTRWERVGVGILGVNLHQNNETGAEVAKQGIRTCGMSFGTVWPAGYTLCYRYISGNWLHHKNIHVCARGRGRKLRAEVGLIWLV